MDSTGRCVNCGAGDGAVACAAPAKVAGVLRPSKRTSQSLLSAFSRLLRPRCKDGGAWERRQVALARKPGQGSETRGFWSQILLQL